MKRHVTVMLFAIAVLGCGSPEPAPAEAETAAAAEAADATNGLPAAAAEAPPAADRCAALEAEPARYDAAGKHIAYSFEYPSGWEIDELLSEGATSIDVRKDLDGRGPSEFILRFGHVVGRPMENAAGLLETWRKMSMIEEIAEIDVDGRTMYLARTVMGDMVSFQALFPDVTSESRAWHVSGGVANAPEECEAAAVESVERIMRSFRPNPDIGPPPGQ